MDSRVLPLSPSESDILRVLWKKRKSKVRDIHQSLKRNKIALTSVAVLLDRLYKKGLVQRKIEYGRGGFHYIYSTVYSESGFKRSIVEKTVNNLIDSFGSVAVNYFNEKFGRRRRK